MTADNKPREFWVLAAHRSELCPNDNGACFDTYQGGLTHVIEHSAYAALEAKFKKAIEQRNECIQVNHMGRESAKLFIKQCDKELGE